MQMIENNFQQFINALQISSSYNDDNFDTIICILKKQNIELTSSFILEFYQSILTLEHWAWQLLSQNSYQWLKKTNYHELFQTLALFNKNLIFYYDNIEVNMKVSLIVPETIECLNGIFENLDKIIDENNSYITIVSYWFDNLSYLAREMSEFEKCNIISYVNRHIARNFIMTNKYKLYLTKLHQLPVLQSVFTAKQLFYVKTCSLSLSSYLFAVSEDFPYSAEDMFRHFGKDFIQIILLHTYNIESWSPQLFTCITYLYTFFSTCCWWGGKKSSAIKIIFPDEPAVCEYVDALIRILSCKSLYQYITPRRSNDQTILLDTVLFSLLNVAQLEDFTWFLRSKTSLSATILTVAETSVCEKISLCAYGILGEILSNQCLKELQISDSVSIFLFNMLEQAWKHPLKKYKQIPIFNLLKGKTKLEVTSKYM